MAETPQNGPRSYAQNALAWCVIGVFAAFALFLVRCHYVKAYSDPTNWIRTAEEFWADGTVARWSVVFAMYLLLPLKLLGLHYVFLSNIPWILTFVALLGGVTYLSCNRQPGSAQGHADAGMCGLSAALAAIHIHRIFFLELVNPLREPLVFSLLLGSFMLLLLFERRQRRWILPVAGMCFGLTIGMREPLAMAGVSLVFFYLAFLYRYRPGDWYAYPGWYAVGVTVGLVPFFIQNHLFSGHWWYPNLIYQGPASLHFLIGPMERYGPSVGVGALLFLVAIVIFRLVMRKKRARRSDEYTPGKSYQRVVVAVSAMCAVFFAVFLIVVTRYELVPGAVRDKLPVTGWKTLLYLWGKLGWIGVVLFFWGLADAIIRRRYRFLLFALPSMVVFLYFWCHVPYVKPRYVLNVEFYTYLFIGVGVGSAASLLSRAVSRWIRPATLYACIMCGLTVPLTIRLLALAHGGGGGLKIWHLPKIKQQLEPVLEEPYVFDSRRRHFSTLLSVTMGGTLTEHYRQRPKLFSIPGVAKDADPDAYLPEVGRQVIEGFSEVNRYAYDNSYDPTVLQWCDYAPVFDLGELALPLVHYGKRLDKNLCKLELWQHEQFETRLSLPSSGKYLLGLNFRRLWDYPERSFCKAQVDGKTVADTVSNGFHFVECDMLPADWDNGARLQVVSDVGLTQHPLIRVHGLGEDIPIRFGTYAGGYANYLSLNMRQRQFLHPKSCILVDEGRIALPNFASSDEEVFARFVLEFWCEDHYFDGVHTISATLEERTVRTRLPGRRRTGVFVVPLGQGQGQLAMKPVMLKTDLPSWEEQIALMGKGDLRERGYVKLLACDIWALPSVLSAPACFGVDRIQPFLVSGFFPNEGPLGDRFCWTMPTARMVLPPSAAHNTWRVRLHIREHRALEFRDNPTYTFNGKPASLDVQKDEQGLFHVLSGLSWRDASPNVLEMSVRGWNPHLDSGMRDERSLGITVTYVEIEALDAQASPGVECGEG
ncbi:MAG: hypothetical protein ISS31_01135 [Kiritimatiellae bacterium]|nr:hypothetical protein [Kiritimatiellia bacterium]